MTPSVSLRQPSDDVDIDLTTAPDEWAFFPAPASRKGRRRQLKAVTAARDESRAVADTDQDVDTRAEPALEEPPAADAISDVDPDPAPDVEPVVVDEQDSLEEQTPVADVASLVETDDAVEESAADEPTTETASAHVEDAADVIVPSRRPAARKPSKRKPAARKSSAPRPSAKPKPSAGATDRPRAPRRPKTEPVPVESDTPTPTVSSDEQRARKRTAKRDFVTAMVLVVIAIAVVGFLVVRDGTPGAPRPSAVDVVTQYARGSEGVIDGDELGFRAEFPGSPKRDSIQLRGPDEEATVRYEWLSFRSGGVEFEAGRLAFPDSVDLSAGALVLRKAADDSARAQHGSVESYREMTVNGDRAAESVVSTSDGSYLHSHTVLHGQTLYIVRIESNVQTQPGFDRFADSFEVL